MFIIVNKLRPSPQNVQVTPNTIGTGVQTTHDMGCSNGAMLSQPSDAHTNTITLACGCRVFISRTMASIPPATSSAVFSWLFVPTQTTMTCEEETGTVQQVYHSTQGTQTGRAVAAILVLVERAIAGT